MQLQLHIAIAIYSFSYIQLQLHIAIATYSYSYIQLQLYIAIAVYCDSYRQLQVCIAIAVCGYSYICIYSYTQLQLPGSFFYMLGRPRACKKNACLAKNYKKCQNRKISYLGTNKVPQGHSGVSNDQNLTGNLFPEGPGLETLIWYDFFRFFCFLFLPKNA